MIELAPAHKIGLTLPSPLVAGGGAWGFAHEYAGLVDFEKLGAFITNPVSLRPRSPAEGRRSAPFPGGTLIHTGLPNAGLTAILRDLERRWAVLGCPVIVHVAATTPDEVAACVDKLERVESVAGIELGLRDDEALADAELLIRAAAGRARQPVILALPAARAGAFARLASRTGVQALTVCAPPRGANYVDGNWLTGRLYGPALLPQALAAVREIKQQTDLPLIGAGGVHNRADVDAMLAAGAAAVQIDSAAWTAGLAALLG